MSIRRACGVAVSSALVACGLTVAHVESDPEPVSSRDGGPSTDVPAPDSEGGASGDGGSGTGVDGGVSGVDGGTPIVDSGVTDGPPITKDANGCPSGRGPAMVKVGSVCIDTTAVTVAQYTVFLERNPSNATSVPQCESDATHQPGVWPQSGADKPVVWVDWCDADAFCRWAGKQLCGNATGGVLREDEWKSPDANPWYAACSNFGERAFPYGNSHDSTACNVNTNGASLADVHAFPSCRGGAHPSLAQMLGNVHEHVNACSGNDCIAAGSSFKSRSTPPPDCSFVLDVSRTSRFDDMGIRCCAYVQ